MTEEFNDSHWAKVKVARLKQGLSRPSTPVTDHPLIGATFYRKFNDEAWTVVEMTLDWRNGPYLSAVLQKDELRRTAVVDAMTCENVGIQKLCAWFEKEFLPHAQAAHVY